MQTNGHRAIAVLFDIDGTLITTGGAGAVAWRRAFEDLYGIPADIGKFSDAGMTDPEVGRRTFAATIGHEPSDPELAKVMSRRLHHLPQAVDESEGYRVLSGVRSTLEHLAGAGYLLGLTTGGVESAAHIKLARGGLNHFFCFGGYGSDSPDRTELTRKGIERVGSTLGAPVDPRQCLVVGDTPKDVEAARGAGAVAVAVASGHFGKDELRETGADAVLGSLEEELPL
jgi:phosphoglycolate phosphatase-like HAD superfamily hydrolase